MNTINRFFGAHRFLSNFWPARVMYEGQAYPSVEHAYQAAKATDLTQRALIAQCETPGRAKRMGRTVKIRAGWEGMKLDIMEKLLREKFADPILAIKLKETTPNRLAEGNTWGDRFWGVYQGEGSNHLGKLLMKIRSEL